MWIAVEAVCPASRISLLPLDASSGPTYCCQSIVTDGNVVPAIRLAARLDASYIIVITINTRIALASVSYLHNVGGETAKCL